MSVRHGERGRDPAVGVDDVDGNITIVDALDGVTQELRGRDDQRKGEQHHRREHIFHPEDGIVGHVFLALHPGTQLRE